MPRDARLYMTFPIDFWTHEKVEPLSDSAFRAFVELNGYSRMHETDGIVKARYADAKWGKESIAELLESDEDRPLLLREGATYRIRDYSEHQFTTADRDKLRDDRRRAGQASANARRTRVQQVFEQDVNTNQLGRERGIDKPSSKEEGAPSPYRRYHPTGTDSPCKGCANARLALEAWKRAEAAKPTPTPQREPECEFHPGYPIPCLRCARDEESPDV